MYSFSPPPTQLYGDDFEVNGEPVQTDAHTMAELKFGSASVWATIWLFLALVCLFIGVVFAIPGPDEKPNFTLCWQCQRAGCFACCNAPGMRLWARMTNSETETADATSTTASATTTPANNVSSTV